MSLWTLVSAGNRVAGQSISGVDAHVTLSALADGSSLSDPIAELRGRSILIATNDQLAAALALVELDGIASRLVLCPPDLSPEHRAAVASAAGIDALVSDSSNTEFGIANIDRPIICSRRITLASCERTASYHTEWVLLTSGTTGVPKMIVHSLATLTEAILNARASATSTVWGTFYDIRRYGGLQVLLRALLGGTSLVLSNAHESVNDFLARAGKHRVSHILGTPTHWRRVLMSQSANAIAPRYVRLSGEIADQPILDQLRAAYPQASIVHAFASTEAGVAFEVHDGQAGFPARLVGQPDAGVEMKVADGSLRIRSARVAMRSLGAPDEVIAEADGFVDTGDVIALRDGRYYFVGRRDGIVNVGGFKVHPEEVEEAINRHPAVRMSLAKAHRSPFTGAVIVADVVLDTRANGGTVTGTEALKAEILASCRQVLAAHKVPAVVHFVPSLPVAASGKLSRANA